MSNKKKIILVANSAHVFDINSSIQPEDLIVRFNLPLSSTLPKTGYRTDILFLANSVDIVQKKLKKNSKFMQFIQSNKENLKIYFAYSDELIKINKPMYKKKKFIFFNQLQPNFNNIAYLSFLNQAGFTDVEVLEDHYYLNLKNNIDPDSNRILSTGLIASYYFLNHAQYEDYDMYLHGFSFEGWDGHAWNEEKKFIDGLIEINKVHLFTQN